MAAQLIERAHLVCTAPDADVFKDWKGFVHDRTRVEALEYELPYLAQELGTRAANICVLTAADNKAGTYKWRGAFNAAYQAKQGGANGLVAASAGNFACGVALASEYFDLPAILFVPSSTSQETIDGITSTSSNGQLHISTTASSVDEAALYANNYAATTQGVAYLHPFDSPLTMGGQGTMVDDILHDAPGTKRIVITTGGSGAISGIAGRLLEHGRSDIELVAAQAQGSDGLEMSIAHHTVTNATQPNALYRGANVRRIGTHCLRQLNDYPNLSVVTTSDDDVRELAELYRQQNRELLRHNVPTYEPTTLLAFAALRSLTDDMPTVVIGTGTNQSLDVLFNQNPRRSTIAPMIRGW